MCNHRFGWTGTKTPIQSKLHCLMLIDYVFPCVSLRSRLSVDSKSLAPNSAGDELCSNVLARQIISWPLTTITRAALIGFHRRKSPVFQCFSLIWPWEDWPAAPTMGLILYLYNFWHSCSKQAMQINKQWGWDYWMRVTTLASSVSMRSRPRHVHASIPQHQVAFRTADKECIIPEAGIAGGYVVNIGQQRRSWSLHVFAQVSRSHHAAAKGSSVSSAWCSTVPWWTRTQKESDEFLDGFPEDNKDRTNMWNNHVEEFHTSHNFRIHQSHQHQHRTPSISVVIWVTSHMGIAWHCYRWGQTAPTLRDSWHKYHKWPILNRFEQ